MSTDVRFAETLPGITDAVVASYAESPSTSHLGHRPLPSREAVVEILNGLKDILYPGYWRRQKLHIRNIEYHVGDLVERLHETLAQQITHALRYEQAGAPSDLGDDPDLEDVGASKAVELLQRIQGDWVIASGSLETGMPPDIYGQVARQARARGQRMVVDTSGPPLALALEAGVDLIKPSLGEFEALVGTPLPDPAAQEAAALAFIRSGRTRMVAVTLGEDGAFLATEAGVIRMPGLPVPFRSAVGAGDSFLAALVLSLSQGKSQRESLAWGIAAGTAAVVCAGTARVHRSDVEEQFRRLAEVEDVGLAPA